MASAQLSIVNLLSRIEVQRLKFVVHKVTGQHRKKYRVQAGFAWEYRTFSQSKTLSVLESEARKASRGLWLHG